MIIMLGFFIFPIVALVVSIFTTKFSFCVRHFTKKIYYMVYRNKKKNCKMFY